MAALYNEIDPKAAAVLEQLIKENVIAPGVVDTRSITEITPDDIKGFTQVHFFAGGGLWSVAARMAGWSDDKPLWTGSCPCQPFSVAGKGRGTDDARHLWPHFHRLIRAIRPPVVVGEQVAGAAGYGWFDGVRTDLEVEDYTSRAVDVPACAVDAPHQRQRLYWIAVANTKGIQGWARLREDGAEQNGAEPTDCDGSSSVVDHSCREGWEGQRGDVSCSPQGRREPHRLASASDDCPTSFWSGSELLQCYDGKTRRAKPCIPLLVDGFPGRMDVWRIAGNAISPVLAAEVLKAHLETALG